MFSFSLIVLYATQSSGGGADSVTLAPNQSSRSTGFSAAAALVGSGALVGCAGAVVGAVPGALALVGATAGAVVGTGAGAGANAAVNATSPNTISAIFKNRIAFLLIGILLLDHKVCGDPSITLLQSSKLILLPLRSMPPW